MGKAIYWTPERRAESFEKTITRLNNGESLRSILTNADRKEYPTNKVFLQWLELNPMFKQKYKAIGITAEEV